MTAIAALVRGVGQGRLAPGVALIRLLGVAGSLARLEAALDAAEAADTADPVLRQGVRKLRTALAANPEGSARAAALLLAHDAEPPGASAEEELARWRRFFDWSVEQSPEASVALYSLGDPEQLAEVTREVVALLRRLEVLGPDRRVLEIGCGIGRFVQALSGEVAQIVGIDISPGMIAVARERCGGLMNVRLLETSGHDLSQFESRSFDLLLAVDVMPYLRRAGSSLVATHLEEAARVLGPGGDFVIFNLSYRQDVEIDRQELRELAARTGFLVLRNGQAQLSSWDGLTFHLRKRD